MEEASDVSLAVEDRRKIELAFAEISGNPRKFQEDLEREVTAVANNVNRKWMDDLGDGWFAGFIILALLELISLSSNAS